VTWFLFIKPHAGMLVSYEANITIFCIMTMCISDDDDVSDSQPITTVIGGSTYVRWGRTTCGNNSQLLYEG